MPPRAAAHTRDLLKMRILPGAITATSNGCCIYLYLGDVQDTDYMNVYQYNWYQTRFSRFGEQSRKTTVYEYELE